MSVQPVAVSQSFGAHDYSPLNATVPRAELRSFRKGSDKRLQDVAAHSENHRIALGLGVSVIALAVVGVTVLLWFGIFAPDPRLQVWFFAVGLSAALLLWLCGGIFRREVFIPSRWRSWYQLTWFAALNGLDYLPHVPRPQFAGSIFNRGDGRVATDVVEISDPLRVDIGNYSYVGEIEVGRVREWGFIRIQLDRRLPNMLLEARTRHSITGTKFPIAFSNFQTLSLEGDFDRYFQLFVPSDYQRDALYVFTPDLMALLIDEAAPYDVEIVDDWMYIYAHKPFRMRSENTYERLDRIIQTVGTKARRQSARYWDDRAGSRQLNLIAASGRRLRKRVNLIYVIGSAVLMAVIAIVLVTQAIADH